MTRPPRIGIDARMYSDAFTGIGRYAYELTKRYFELRPDIEWVIFLNQPEYEQFDFPSHVQKVCADAAYYSFSEQTQFWRVLESHACDLMHFTHFNVPLLYRKPFVVTVHDVTLSLYPGKKMNTWWRRAAYRRVMSHAVHNARQVISVSHNTAEDLKKFFSVNPEKITTIWNGLGEEFYPLSTKEIQAVRKKYDLPEYTLLYTGVWREHKNLVRLLQAFALLREAHPKKDIALVLTGRPDPFYPEVLQIRRELGLTDSVRLPGLVPFDDLVGLYNAADAFVFPSLYEGFGFPPLEAMRCGTPVAASRAASIPEVCGEAAAYFDPLNVAEMKTVLEQVLFDTKTRKKLSEKAPHQITKFSWDTCARQTLDILESHL